MRKHIIHLLATGFLVTGLFAQKQDHLITVNDAELTQYIIAEAVKSQNLLLDSFKAEPGDVSHFRQPTPLDKQSVIRMNMDTLYSVAVVDLRNGPVTFTIPHTDRYIVAAVNSNDHYMYTVKKPGEYTITRDKIGTDHALITWRILVSPHDLEDVKKVNKIQDQIKVIGGKGERPKSKILGTKAFDKLYAYVETATHKDSTLDDSFVWRDEKTSELKRAIGAHLGLYGLPKETAMYQTEFINKIGCYSVHIKEVPVHTERGGFWSLSLYDADYYLYKNSVITSRDVIYEKDGSFTLRMGCEGAVNNVPVVEGWNYTFRTYEPKDIIINGTWKFPKPVL